MKIVSHSVAETLLIGQIIGENMTFGDVVGLIGELGAGKTYLTKGIAMGLGLKDAQVVTSPSFVLLNTYNTRIPLRHFDLYRVDGSEIIALGFLDFRETGISVIEWADKVNPDLLGDFLRIELAIKGEPERSIDLSASNVRYLSLINGLIQMSVKFEPAG